jgi:hypothetical protein
MPVDVVDDVPALPVTVPVVPARPVTVPVEPALPDVAGGGGADDTHAANAPPTNAIEIPTAKIPLRLIRPTLVRGRARF